VFICETWIEAKRRMNEKIRRRKRKEKRENKRWRKNEEQDDFIFLVFFKFQNNKYIFQPFQNLDFFFKEENIINNLFYLKKNKIVEDDLFL
jgi:hypothetical protein